MKIAIVDCIGLDYDGTTLQKKGIGGSESSIISIARELVKIGFSVTIYNNCNTSDTSPGIYDGVEYRDLYAINQMEKRNYDVVISQRTVIPFTPPELFDQVRQPYPREMFEPEWFEHFRAPSIHKILWMQDTFVWGDHLLEGLVLNGQIDEIFNLSDWHLAYTMNCTHGPRRIYEVLKPHMFHTRNGINRYIDEVDISAKDPNLFVYNASVTKGMGPLVYDVWPRVKQRIPEAKLKIVGGYYDFKKEPDSPFKVQFKQLTEAVANDPSIEFTGIIPQHEIAKLLAKASFTIYPGAYPETSGISTLESINYNTPVIGTRFGAMNETGTEAAGYYIDYAIEPNVLAPWLNKDAQVDKFVDLVCSAHANKYLHQQKMYACNAVKGVSTWDTIALQWKQHLYHKLGKVGEFSYLSEEHKKVSWINYRVHKVFERRFSNPSELDPLGCDVDKVEPLKQDRPTLAIIDIMGMAYDGATLGTRGIGGSEAAAAQIAEELQKIGFDVTIYNACDEEGCAPGVYNDVKYRPLSALGTRVYDVLISSRAVTPFVPANVDFQETLKRTIDYKRLENMRQAAKLKIVWLHDTFCQDGDHIIEDLVTHKHIDEVWTLSDFHYNYFQYCAHPRLRIPEVLRNHTWITRNGMRRTEYDFDPYNKDGNLFVFNANRSKGLKPLLRSVWPKIKEKIPHARLTVIGGYYNLGKAYHHDNEEEDFYNLIEPYADDESITFTGVITLDQVYNILKQAAYLLYPTDQPETFSISTLEALYHNLVVISTNFAAMEEIGSPGYHINYSSTPNALKHDINEETQAEKLAELCHTLYHTERTHVDGDDDILLRKHLDAIKPIAFWDTVALEWKQHLFGKLGLYLSATESAQALNTKAKWQKIFGRRTTTPEQWVAPTLNFAEGRIVVISPFYNAKPFLQKCIHSVAGQIYSNYLHVLIDDCSTDGSADEARRIISELPEDLQDRFLIVENDENRGAVYNQVRAIRNMCLPNDIVMLLDGDDSLVNRPDVFTYYNELHKNYDFTYGSCWSEVDNIPLVGQPYPEEVKRNKSYKDHKFNWVVPYTHLRTFKAWAIQGEDNEKFTDNDGQWYKAGGDLSIFYTAIENCEGSRVYAVPDIVYNYNDKSPLNDYKINAEEQNRTVSSVLAKGRKKTSTAPQKAYILRSIQVPSSIAYAKMAAESCDKIGLPWEYYDGHYYKTPHELWRENKTVGPYQATMQPPAASCTENHFALWRKIAEHKETAIILEHDAVMLHPVTMDIPHGRIVTLGYKLLDISKYDHVAAGPPTTIRDVPRHSGAHAYAITYKTAEILLEEVDTKGVMVAIDNMFFMKQDPRFSADTPLSIMDPTPAICWVRESTLDWIGEPFVENYDVIESFKNNYKEKQIMKPKKILIAIPCKNDIQADTFKSIYDLELPQGYVAEFQYFYGYAVAQVRNLIASWVVNGDFDYLFAVDHDITFPKDTLVKLLSHDKDLVCGVYRQRLDDLHIELYDLNYVRLPTDVLTGELIQIGACGFGCVLTKKEVFAEVGYPQFVYHEAERGIALSEDVDFCKKANEKGFKLYADTSILCGHIGTRVFEIPKPEPKLVVEESDPMKDHIRMLQQNHDIPLEHINFLKAFAKREQVNVVYDIGAAFLHWTNRARSLWPNARFIAFDAMKETEFLYQEANLGYVSGAVLYKEDNVELDFYENVRYPFGNSLYKENSEFSPRADELFNETTKVKKTGMTLDTLAEMFKFPKPDLIKLDVQGAELDVLAGASKTLEHCKYIILEAQSVQYNTGAPLQSEAFDKLNELGYKLVSVIHQEEHYGDYLFEKIPDYKNRIRELRADKGVFPENHFKFVKSELKDKGFKPKVVYDIGACVLHWTDRARKLWPKSEFIVFEAMDETKFLYEEEGLRHFAGAVLHDVSGETVTFNQNVEHPGGNSIYDENLELIASAGFDFPKFNQVTKTTVTLNDLIERESLPLPDLIKIDVQGAELNVLKGASKALEHCTHIIIELQEVDYNIGSPKLKEVEEYLNSKGFFMTEHGQFNQGCFDGDYLFIKKA